jgi:hypothetical protein
MKKITWFILVNLIASIACAAVNTPNMSLVQPTIGVDSGLFWEQSTNSNSTIIDGHNHTPGYGVQIPPAGLNLNSNVTFQNNSATNLKASIFTPQASFATLYSIYTIGNDLYYNDGAGNVIQLTSGGVVNATASGISDGSGNSAAFVGGVLVVKNTSTAPDNIQAASLLMGNVGTASSKYLTLNPPAAMGSNIAETLPTIPGSTLPMTMDSSGNMGTAQIVAGQITSGTITTTQINGSAGITTGQIAAVGQQVSSSCGSYLTTSTSYANVTNLSVTITTTGKPVELSLIPDGTSSGSSLGSNVTMTLEFFNSTSSAIVGVYTLPTNQSIIVPPPPVKDVPAAGTYTYVVRVILGSSGVGGVTNLKLFAYEIK